MTSHYSIGEAHWNPKSKDKTQYRLELKKRAMSSLAVLSKVSSYFTVEPLLNFI